MIPIIDDFSLYYNSMVVRKKPNLEKIWQLKMQAKDNTEEGRGNNKGRKITLYNIFGGSCPKHVEELPPCLKNDPD